MFTKANFLASIALAGMILLGQVISPNGAITDYAIATATDTEDYFPIELQQTWRYRWWNSTYEKRDIIDHVTMLGISDGKSLMYFVSTHPYSHSGSFWFSHKADGVYLENAQTIGGSNFPVPLYYAYHFLAAGTDKLIQYPVALGAHWNGISKCDGAEIAGAHTLENYATISVPAGTFETIHIHSTIQASSNTITGVRDMWFANHVGLVKLIYAHGDGSITTIELDTPQPAYSRSMNNPVLQPVSENWDSVGVGSQSVLYNPDRGGYQLWYAGISNMDAHVQIGYAESSDGESWRRSTAQPVLAIGQPGEWDDDQINSPTVIYHDGNYKMWYAGNRTNQPSAIGYASSSDGIHWQKHASNPVMAGGQNQWDAAGIRSPSVLFRDGIYHMWYSNVSSNSSIGYATSNDGLTWVKSEKNPILVPGDDGTWDHFAIFEPTVFYDETLGRFEMWYTGYESDQHTTNRFGRAFSLDGHQWIKDDAGPFVYPESDYLHPILDGSKANQWESMDVIEPLVIMVGGRRHLWYTGVDWNITFQIGLARSPVSIFLPICSK